MDAARPARRLGVWWWLLAPVLAGTAVRFGTLAHQSLWNDESATLVILHQPLHSLVSAVKATESTPPLYYLIAWPWTRLFGFGEAGVRSLSALCGTATILILGLTGRRLGGRSAGAVTAWLAAMSPVLVWYSQEARAYALFVLLAAGSLAVFLALLDAPSTRRLVALTLIDAAALATHYFAGFLVGAELAVLLVRPPPGLPRPRLVVPAVVLLLTAAPLYVLARAQSANSSFVQSQSLARTLAEVPGQLLVGYGVDPVMVACGALAAVGLLLCLWRLRRLDARPAGASRLLVVGVLAALAPVAVAVVGPQLLDMRNVIYLLVPVVVLAAVGAVAGRRWPVAVPMIAGAAVMIHVYADPTLQRTDYRGAAAAIGVGPGPRAVVVEMSGQADLAQYIPRLRSLPDGGAHVRELVVVGMTMGGGLNRQVPAPNALRVRPPPGFRLVQTVAARSFSLRRFQTDRQRTLTPATLLRATGAGAGVFIDP